MLHIIVRSVDTDVQLLGLHSATSKTSSEDNFPISCPYKIAYSLKNHYEYKESKSALFEHISNIQKWKGTFRETKRITT